MTKVLPVVVGVDDSPGSDAALSWAFAEARARRAPLRVICAYQWVSTYLPTSEAGFADWPESDSTRVRETAEKLVATAVQRLALVPSGGDVEISGEAIEDKPVAVLVDASARAAVVVLGSRQLHAFGAVVLGSVGAGVAARAACPVVVVRGPAADPADGPDADGEVVVGVDCTDPAEAVLRFGFDHASRHHLVLRAVLCWQPDPFAALTWQVEPSSRAEAWLSETLAGWRAQYPDVVVHETVASDRAVAGLVTTSAAQHLLVVGSRTRHALLGTLLGSVSQGVLHHATCPVAVIPIPHDPAEGA